MSAAMFAAVKEMKLEIADLKLRVAALEAHLEQKSPETPGSYVANGQKPVLSLKKA